MSPIKIDREINRLKREAGLDCIEVRSEGDLHHPTKVVIARVDNGHRSLKDVWKEIPVDFIASIQGLFPGVPVVISSTVVTARQLRDRNALS